MRFGDLGFLFRLTIGYLVHWILGRLVQSVVFLITRPGALGREWFRSARLGTEPMLRRLQRSIVAQRLDRMKPAWPGWADLGPFSRLALRTGQVGMVGVLLVGLWLWWPHAAAAPVRSGPASLPLQTQDVRTARLGLPTAPQEDPVAQIESSAEPMSAGVPAEAPRSAPAAMPLLAGKARMAGQALAADAWPVMDVPPLERSAEERDVAWVADPRALIRLRLRAVRAVTRAQAQRLSSPPAEEAAPTAEVAQTTEPPSEERQEAPAVIGGPKVPPGRAEVTWQPLPPPTPTPAPPAPAVNAVPGPLWPTFQPQTELDHLWVGNPLPPEANRFYSLSYAFGSTAGGRYRVHHGLDISNPTGTPVLAAVSGEVVHAGPDMPTILGPYSNFYGNAVVIRLDQRLPTPEGEKDVYVLYGHLSAVYAQMGQRVAPQDVVGAIGMTGIAIGPHLHVEVRVGENSYAAAVNPLLWMVPVQGTGVVAVRVVDAQGRAWPGVRVGLIRYENGQGRWYRTIETYLLEGEPLRPDPVWGENSALSHVPPGVYYVTATINGEKVGQEIRVEPGRTTFVELRTRQ